MEPKSITYETKKGTVTVERVFGEKTVSELLTELLKSRLQTTHDKL